MRTSWKKRAAELEAQVVELLAKATAPSPPLVNGLTREEFEERRTFIGASDAAAVLGLSPYGGPLDIYTAKVLGALERDPANESIPIAMGRALEPVILTRYSTATGRLLKKGERRRHRKYPFIAATPDALVDGEARLVEAKWAGSRTAHHFDDDTVPDQYFVQVQQQLEVFDCEVADLAAIIDGEFRIFEIRRDRELWSYWEEQLVDFWTNHVVPRDPPPPRDREEAERFVRRRYPRETGPLIAASPEDLELARNLARLRAHAKSTEAEIEALEKAIKTRCGEAAGIVGVCSWKTDAKGRPKWKAIAEAMRPPEDLIAKHTEPPGRRFLFTYRGEE